MGKRRRSEFVTLNNLLFGSFIILILLLVLSHLFKEMAWTGFGNQDTKVDIGKIDTTKQNQTNKQESENIKPEYGLIIKQGYKTLWDWLQLGGTVAIPIVILLYQHNQNKQADIISREETLLTYFKHISELLIDKNLNDDQVLCTVLDVVRACTLSVLRMLDNDGERKGRMIRFLSDAELINTSLCLESANLSHADLTNVKLKGAKLGYANLEGADLSLTDERIIIPFQKYPEKIIEDYKCKELSKKKPDKSQVQCKEESEKVPDTRKRLLEYVDGDIQLYCANLKGAKLYGRFLLKACLENAILTNANLTKTNLTGADLSGADLSGADLSGADLTKANLTGANLTGANLTGANLTGADLTKAILKDAKYTEKIITLKLDNNKSICLSSTKFPSGFDPKANEMELLARE
jgi:uncharacterized protein YjbI with pentapeptide repeats